MLDHRPRCYPAHEPRSPVNAFSFRRSFLAAIAGCSIATLAPSQITWTTVSGVGTPHDLSDDGTVIVGSTAARAVRWTAATGAVLLPSGSEALGVSSDGAVVVGNNPVVPFRWTESGGITHLAPPPNTYDSRVKDLSADGSTAVGYGTYRANPSSLEAMRWVGAAAPEPLGQLGGGRYSQATAISADGSTIVGHASDASLRAHAFRWTETEGMVDLGLMGGYNSLATAVSASGEFIAGYGLNSLHSTHVTGFIWSEATGKIPLGIPGYDVIPTGISADGAFAIGYRQNGNQLGGFVWTPESGVRDFASVLKFDYGLNDVIGNLDEILPLAMSPDGRYIAGAGFSAGTGDSWLLDRGLNPPPLSPFPITPVPEPAAFAIWAAVLLAVLIVLRRRLPRPLAA